MSSLRLPPVRLPGTVEGLRAELRAFLAQELAEGSFVPRCDAWLGAHSPEFSRKVARRGWLGMTWPARYGGHERSALERYTVTEELLVAGAPVAAHWIADRQTGPSLLRYGTEEQRQRFLGPIARGECYFAIGMSEPDSGSDLASVRTRATRIDGGFLVNGTKIWTSHAHRSHFMFILCRTSPLGTDRHEGLSQLILDLSAPGVTIRAIPLLTGAHHFNEVVMQDVFVGDDLVLGQVGEGWRQVTSELAFERSGPERLLSTFPLLVELVAVLGPEPGERAAEAIGRLAAHLWALRGLSLAVAAAIDAGEAPAVQAALVKDLGTRLEREVAEVARLVAPERSRLPAGSRLFPLLTEALLTIPGFTLRGGTTEILRGIVARSLEVR